MPENSPAPIGGYFELELGSPRAFPYRAHAFFQSARYAFQVLLRYAMPKRVWVPRFICDSMLAPLKTLQVEIEWYDLNEDFTVDKAVTIGPQDWLLYVNYFGICDRQVTAVLKRFKPEQVVLDYSQAFFSPPRSEARATIYSPRKFFGIPDGGVVVGDIVGKLPELPRDVGSLSRMSHLLQRLDSSPEQGYAEYCRAEESLANQEPKRISIVTERVLETIDFERAKKKRQENFEILRTELAPLNTLTLDNQQGTAPLCFPFLAADAELRQRLVDQRIFVPTYWVDAIPRVGEPWAEKMVRNLLPLPIDQRYGKKEMQRLVSVIQSGAV